MFLSYFLIEKNIKSVFILHDLLPLQFNFKEYDYLLDGFKTYLYNNICTSYKVICVSEFTKNCLNEYLQQHPYHFGYPPILNIPMPYQFRDEEKNIKLDEASLGNTFKILLPGSIESRKQQILFMKIFNKFIKKNPELDVELIVFGKVAEILKEEFEKEITRSNGKIEYLNYISNKELGNLYKDATLTCVLSLYEGWGMPIAESLWNGTPVLTSNFGSMKEVGGQGGCLLVDSTKESDIYNALDTLIKSSTEITKLKEDIKKCTFLDWNTYSNQLLNECLLLF
jgi:glycosyltransferase involved in cell wall biosynthesis